LWTNAGLLFPLETGEPTVLALASSLAAGLACGAFSAALTAGLYRVEDLFTKLSVHWMWWPAIGGLVVGIGGYLEPRTLGIGFDVIRDLLANHLVLSVVATLLLVKLVIWIVALGSGTSGGVLAPLLMMGAGLGCLMGHWMPGGDPALWALVCMAATLGGTMRAPLTATVFAFGLTHDVNAFVPTLLACVVAYGFTVIVMPRSILTEKIARRGRHVFREYGVDPLERHFIDEVMTRNVVSISADMSIAEVLRLYFGPAQSHRAYPVVNGERLVGIVDRARLTGLAPEAAEQPIATLLAGVAVEHAVPGETCRSAASRMAALEMERFAVVESAATLRLLGIVSRSDLLKVARQLHEEESHRERFFPRHARSS
jgi:CBS domain-containing protein